MNDAHEVTRIADPARYTLHFGADRWVGLRLDCNRGSGTWKAQAAGPLSGTLAFGPVAATRAFCPPPSVGDRLARDLSFVRSYLMKDGRLYLSLQADGSIYEWHSLKD